MDYSTVAQVQSEFKELEVSATTPITTSDVTRFIEEADAEINGKIGLLYVTPVTSGDALVILRQISIGLVAQRCKDILEVKTGSEEADQDSRKDLAVAARRLLDQIVANKLILSGATKRSSGDGVKSYNVGAGVEHTFDATSDQW